MNNNIRTSIILVLLYCMHTTNIFGQNPGEIIFTNEFNNNKKKKEVNALSTFTPSDNIYATIYTKVPFIATNDIPPEKIMTVVVGSSDGSDFGLFKRIKLTNKDMFKRFYCLPIVEIDSFDINNEDHMSYLELLLSGKELVCYLYPRKYVRGTFKIDTSSGTGKYYELKKQLDEKHAAIEAEKEKIRMERQKRREERELLWKEKMDKYLNSDDLITIYINNTGINTAYLTIQTDDVATNQYFKLGPGIKSKAIRCRPGNIILENEKKILVITPDQNTKTFDFAFPAPIFKGMRTSSNGLKAWRHWNIFTNSKNGSFNIMYYGDDPCGNWEFSVPKANGSIKTTYYGNKSWYKWELSGTGNATIQTKYWGGETSWKEWVVYNSNGEYNVKAKGYGSNAWQEWLVTGEHGEMTIKTEYWGGDNAWHKWVITDRMKNGDIHLKVGAIFAVMFSGAIAQKF